ncbi:MAG: ABC transporter ATP-binding protein [Bacillota bacterium]|nr:ABC transporter ATP-binding protein [Bacillota bacterium]
MLEVKSVCTFYGKIQALFGVSLQVNQGEIVTLIGANGAGKTTTLKTISGLLRPAEGEVVFEGRRIDRARPASIVKMGVVHVPEGRRIFPGLTVRENLEMGAVTRRSKREEITRDMEMVFDLFPRLRERHNQLGWSLSGGEQQMLAIGRAIMARPRVILFDEPSLGLAPVVVKVVFDSIARLNKELGATVLLVEQNAQMALSISNRAYVLENGAVRVSGNSAELLKDPEVKAAYLGFAGDSAGRGDRKARVGD